MSAVNNNPVFVYNGPAADPQCVKATVDMLERFKIPAQAAGIPVLHDLEALKKARAIVIPGSQSAGRMRFGMGDLGVRNIYMATHNFQRPYLGLCAGGILASDGLVYNGELLYKCPAPRLFQGAAEVAPIPGENNPNARTVQLPGQSGRLYYENGPSFKDAARFNHVKVLGTYTNGAAAIIHSTKDGANAVLSGVHPELTQSAFAHCVMRTVLQKLGLLKRLLK